MPFDLIRFARAMVSASGHLELLRSACEAAAVASEQPAFAVHVLPGRAWKNATVVSAGKTPEAIAPAVRSALFAVYRQVALRAGALQIARNADSESIFGGLLPDGPSTLDAVPLRNQGGQLTGVLVTGHAANPDAASNIADLEAIAALIGPAMDAGWRYTLARRDQERLQLFSETSDETLWDWDLESNELWWGGNLERLFSEGVAFKRPDWRRAYIHRDDAGRVIASFEAALASNASSWSEQYRFHLHQEALLDVREHVYFLRDAGGHAYRAIGTVRDISALQQLLVREKEARAAAEQASIFKDQFLAMLGHELRNPLAPIIGAVELLERRSAAPDRQLEILRRQAQHLVRLVDDLLDVSRISRGKVELDRQRTLVEPLVARAVEMVLPLIEQRRHQLKLDVAKDLGLNADSVRITQVLSNLLANAAKYTEPGGQLLLSAHAEDGCAVFRVRDDGIGIAPEFLPRLFDMFTQSPMAIDRAQGGLGLGLSIVKNIVQLHGGAVEAYSQGLGHGSEIVVRLPLAEPEAPAAVRPPQDANQTPTARHVLIVDDNEDAAELLGELLTASGHVVRVTHHPDDALKLFSEAPPDVALLDIGLPGMDGYELARCIRAQPHSANTKLIALTGYGQASDKEKASNAGFDAHLVKPISPSSLERLIADLTSSPVSADAPKGSARPQIRDV